MALGELAFRSHRWPASSQRQQSSHSLSVVEMMTLEMLWEAGKAS